jgi:hypothetical protein
MTNAPDNRGNCGHRCAICGKKLRGYLNWLCKDHRTPEFAAQANEIYRQKQSQADGQQTTAQVTVSNETK